jgi:hypothetical protein
MHLLSIYFTVLGFPFVLSMDVTVTFLVLIGAVLIDWCNGVITRWWTFAHGTHDGDGVKTRHLFRRHPLRCKLRLCGSNCRNEHFILSTEPYRTEGQTCT